jgi:hypothetical protein
MRPLIRARRLGLTIAFLLIVVDLIVGFSNRPEPIGLDFHTYAAAAKVGLQQGWSHIYDQRLVTIAQASLVPDQRTQPYLSPPPVAWLAAVLVRLPYDLAFVVWSFVTALAVASAVAWSSASRATGRWLAAGLVITPWWFLIADWVGQVVPLVAVGILVGWRLLREDRDIAAGLVLGLVLLKPNTAFLVPLALLAAGRKRTFLTWLVVAGVGLVLLFEIVGVAGLTAYVNQLEHPPLGTDALSLEATFGISGSITLVLRLVIIATVLAAACGMRKSPGLAIVVGTLGSLLVTPYLHLSDLTLLAVAGWIVWRERPSVLWRTPLMASWILVNPLVAMQITPAQNRWPLFELAWLIALAANSWQKSRQSKRDSKLALLRAPESAAPLGLTSPLRRRVLRHPGDPVMESADHAEASPPAA